MQYPVKGNMKKKVIVDKYLKITGLNVDIKTVWLNCNLSYLGKIIR